MSDYDASAATYDAAHGGARARRRFQKIEAPILRATASADSVLEVGVGTGRLLSQVRAAHRVGLDRSPAMLAEAAKQHDSLDLVLGDANALPFGDQSFDAVIAGKGVFRYLDLERALTECARVTRPGGRLAFHQYSARTWSLRGALGRDTDSAQTRAMHVDNPADVARVIEAAGYRSVGFHLFRSVRFYPYALEIPRLIAGRLWSHVVFVATRSNAKGDASN